MWIVNVLKDMAKPSTLLEAIGNALSFAIAIGLVLYGVFLLTLIGV